MSHRGELVEHGDPDWDEVNFGFFAAQGIDLDARTSLPRRMGAEHTDVLGQPLHAASCGLGLLSIFATRRASLDRRTETPEPLKPYRLSQRTWEYGYSNVVSTIFHSLATRAADRDTR